MESDIDVVGDLGFGQSFTDHMAVARYNAATGWTDVEVVPFAELAISPAAMVFHYGQAIFEGLKAFRQPDGAVALFRPADNAARFNRSAARLAMPELAVETFTAACAELVLADRRSVPSAPGHSLYLRPIMIATEASLGVRPAAEYLFAVMASPVGTYFASGVRAITVWTTNEFVRAAPGGTGAAKCAGNYAASLAGKEQARAHGCDEALWLDAEHRRWIEELSGMNVVLVAEVEGRPALVTPPIGATILDGITRRSLLELAPHLGYHTVERPVAIDELCRTGAFLEAFACGTAAAVAPIGAVRSAGGDTVIGDGSPGAVTTQLRDALVAIQEGRSEDGFGWRVQVAEAAPDD